MKNNVKYLSSDKIREELWGDENIQRDPKKVFKLMNERAISFLKNGDSIIYDATNLSEKRRRSFLKTLPKNVSIWKRAIVVITSPKVCIERRKTAARKIPEEVIMKQLKSFSCPSYEEGWDEIEFVLGCDIEKNKEFILDTFQKAANMNHDNPHHPNSTILSHCNAVEIGMYHDVGSIYHFANMGVFHDLGKVYTQFYDENNIAHYYCHDCVSAYISLLRYQNYAISDMELLYQTKAIEYHMRSICYRDKEKYEEWVNKLCKILQIKLNILCNADRADSVD